ncbi:hypothetical protein WJX81_008378 [Elliptochloris bilobata]|uniref:Uncharacterized protein n=1 Tax=Elliptochloris bilobata TaxID=381761 RepID=A0AAW1QZ77_9CHLO
MIRLRGRCTVPRMPWLWQALLALAALQLAAAGPLMAIDFGGEFIKVSVVKPGRTPISIVPNEMSKRRTTAAVAFVNGDRLLGEEAAALAVRYPDRVYARTRDLLGKRADSPDVAALLQRARLPYALVPDAERGTVAVKSPDGTMYTAEELVASVIHYARRITEAASEGAPVLDCVIAIPAFFGPAQRQALIDSAQLAGVNVLALINSHAAAALQYGIERDFTNRSEWVILYDMGAASTEAALVRFSSFSIKEYGKAKTYSQFEVVDVAWDDALGAEVLDQALLEHFAAAFAEKHGHNPLASPKALAKLRRQVKRTKEILSANSEAPFSVEELMDGIDFRASITRDAFEALAGGFFARAAAPVAALLARNGLAPGDLAAVELLGGGSRVPRVQAELQAALGGRALDKHLDADEAVVLGAGLFAANLSTTFRLRKFGMADGATYPVHYQLEAPAGADASDPAYRPKALLPFMKRLPARRVVHLPEGAADPVTFRLALDATERSLPPGTDAPELAEYTLSGIGKALAAHAEPGKVSVHFRADSSGLIALEKAEAVFETTEEYSVQAPVVEAEGAKVDGGAAAAAGGEGAAGKGGEAAKEAESAPAGNDTQAAPKFQIVKKTRAKTVREPLAVGGPGLRMPGLSPAQLKVSRGRLEALEKHDAGKREAAAAKNDLEAYIIAMRGALESGDALAQVTTEKQRITFLASLAADEDWLYSDEGEAAQAPAFRKRMAALRAARTAAGVMWPTQKPWINATDIEALQAQLVAYEAWLDGEEKKQAKLAPTAPPTLFSADIMARLAEPRRLYARLKATKKPKPPPAPPANATADGTANATAGAAQGAESAGAGGGAGPQAAEGTADASGGPELPEGLRDIFANGGMKLVGKDGVERTFGDLDALAAEAQRQKAEREAREAAKDEL